MYRCLNINMTKYLLCRPESGLNDMLNQIEICYMYATANDRIVIVDTNHVSSKHFRDEFDHYFTSTDPNLVLSARDYTELFDNVSVYPPFLSGRVSNYQIESSDVYQSWIDTKFRVPIRIDYSKSYDETLLVHQHFGGGTYSLSALQKLKLNQWLVDLLVERLTFINGEYSAIHIRNTDIKSNYKAALDNLKNAEINKLFLATDSYEVQQYFKNYFGDRLITFTQISEQESALHYCNSNPRQSNTDAILDLLTLALSNTLYAAQLENCSWATHSGFSMLAWMLTQNKSIFESLISDSRIKISS